MLTTRRYCQHTIAAIFCAELKLEPPCSLMARLTDRDKVDYLPVDWDDLAALFDMITFPKDSDDDRCAVEKDMDVIYRKTLRIIEAAKSG